MMVGLRFHGRGGQGVVTASQILAQAYLIEYPNLYVQAFPEFGADRRGAPVVAFLMHTDKRRSRIETPNHVIVFDESLIKETDALNGLKPDGWIIINTTTPENAKCLAENYSVCWIDASKIAREYNIGQPTQPIINTVILGAFSKASAHFQFGQINVDSVKKAIEISKDIPNTENNLRACVNAFEHGEIVPREK